MVLSNVKNVAFGLFVLNAACGSSSDSKDEETAVVTVPENPAVPSDPGTDESDPKVPENIVDPVDVTAMTITDLTDGLRWDTLSQSPVVSWTLPTGLSVNESVMISFGTSPGSQDILDWTDVGLADSSQLEYSAPNGKTIYTSVKLVSTGGTSSSVITSDGFDLLECPSDTSPTGVGIYTKVHGDETAKLGGIYYAKGSKTLLDWSAVSSANAFTPSATERSISDFCIAKYEMKLFHSDELGDTLGEKIADDPTARNSNYTSDYADPIEKAKYRAVSMPHGKPWNSIGMGHGATVGALEACSDLGDGFRLIDNAQWQTVARNFASDQNNWSDNGTPNDNSDDYLNSGNQNGAGSLAADIILNLDDDPCVGTGMPNCADKQNPDYIANRIFVINEGKDKIWDFSGNIFSWTYDLNFNAGGLGAGGTAATGYLTLDMLIGDGAVDKAQNRLNWQAEEPLSGLTTSPYGGIGYIYDTATPGGDNDTTTPALVARGGDYDIADRNGVFTTYLPHGLAATDPFIGFRCVYAP